MFSLKSVQLVAAASLLIAGCSKSQEDATPFDGNVQKPRSQEDVWQDISARCNAHFRQTRAQGVAEQRTPNKAASQAVYRANAPVQTEIGADAAIKTINQLLDEESFIGQLQDGRCCEVQAQHSFESDGSVHEVRVQMEVEGNKGGPALKLGFWVNRDPGPKVLTWVSSERVQVMRAIQSMNPKPDDRAEASNYISFRLDESGAASISIYDVTRIETALATASCERRPLP